MTTGRRVPRALHPAAWWLWAIGLAVAASQTANPLLLVLVLGVVGFVVSARRTEAPWARGFRYFLILALVVIAIRVVLRAVFGGGVGGHDHLLFTMPRIPLPHWMADVQLGGPVSVQAILAAVSDGLRLGCLLCCVGAANALANPKRALRMLPSALHEIATSLVVAISVAPQLVESVQRVNRARRLRAGHGRGFRVLRTIAIPVFEDALERSLLLAAAMESRGYGLRRELGVARRRATTAALLAGLVLLCLGLYGLLDGSSALWPGLLATIAGVALCVAGLIGGTGSARRTTYRPDRWGLAETLVVATGIVPAVVLVGGFGTSAAALAPGWSPLAWPPLPGLPAAAIVIAALAGVLAPAPPLSRRTAGRPVVAPVRVEVTA